VWFRSGGSGSGYHTAAGVSRSVCRRMQTYAGSASYADVCRCMLASFRMQTYADVCWQRFVCRRMQTYAGSGYHTTTGVSSFACTSESLRTRIIATTCLRVGGFSVGLELVFGLLKVWFKFTRSVGLSLLGAWLRFAWGCRCAGRFIFTRSV
jgi:hypothetical protein